MQMDDADSVPRTNQRDPFEDPRRHDPPAAQDHRPASLGELTIDVVVRLVRVHEVAPIASPFAIRDQVRQELEPGIAQRDVEVAGAHGERLPGPVLVR